MVKILKTLSIEELQLLRRIMGTNKVTESLLLPRILQDCTDLTAEGIFQLTEEEVLDIFDQLFEKSLANLPSINSRGNSANQ